MSSNNATQPLGRKSRQHIVYNTLLGALRRTRCNVRQRVNNQITSLMPNETYQETWVNVWLIVFNDARFL